MTPLSQTATSPLVGRRSELASLDAAFSQAEAGRGATVLIAAEAGLGKSKLVMELASKVVQRGHSVFLGHCFEQDASVPFAALAEVARALDARQPVAGEGRSLQAALLSDIEQAARRRPVLLVLEDLHWADEGTLEFALRLARRARELPLLMLLTYRPDDIAEPLLGWLAALDREHIATEVSLSPLASAEVGELLQQLLGLPHTPPRPFVEAVRSLTDGNPFFIEEILKALLSGGLDPSDATWDEETLDRLRTPRTVQHAVQRRLDLVSAEARAALILASVLGRRFDFDLLRPLLDTNEQRLLMCLREAVDAGLVNENADGTFEFRHALTRRAIYAQLLVRERQALHRRVADALAPSADEHLPGLSYHAFEARTWEAAGQYAMRAAERALRVPAPRAAILELSRVIECDRQLDATTRPDVWQLRAEAHETVGDFERALADFEAALAGAEGAADRRAQWDAMRAIGMLWASRDYAKGLPWYERALALAEELGDEGLRVRSLNHLGNWHANAGDLTEARRLHAEALAIAEVSGQQALVAETLDFATQVEAMDGRLIAARDIGVRAIELFEAMGDQRALSSVYASLCTFAGGTADFYVCAYPPHDERYERMGREALRLARELDWQAGEAYALLVIACLKTCRGELDAARDWASEALTLSRTIEHEQWMIGAMLSLALAEQARRDADSARRHLHEALALAHAISSRFWIESTICILLLLELESANHAVVRQLLSQLRQQSSSPHGRIVRLAEFVGASLATAEGDHASALNRLDALCETLEDPEVVVPPLAAARGRLLSNLGRTDEAIAELESAIATAASRSWRLQQADALEALGMVLEPRDPVRARTVRAEADALREVIAGSIADPGERATYLGRSADRPSSRSARHDGHLTLREREVLGLIVAGLSNAEIAQQLVIEKRTVETHVAHLYRKTGVSTRPQVIRWALDRTSR